MTSIAAINVGKRVTQYTKYSVFWLAQMMLLGDIMT